MLTFTAREDFLFVWGFSSHSRIFHSYEDFTIAVEGLRISQDETPPFREH